LFLNHKSAKMHSYEQIFSIDMHENTLKRFQKIMIKITFVQKDEGKILNLIKWKQKLKKIYTGKPKTYSFYFLIFLKMII